MRALIRVSCFISLRTPTLVDIIALVGITYYICPHSLTICNTSDTTHSTNPIANEDNEIWVTYFCHLE